MLRRCTGQSLHSPVGLQLDILMGLGAGERGEKEEAWFLSTESF